MTTGIDTVEETQSSSRVYFFLQERDAGKYWNGDSWQQGMTGIQCFDNVDSALERAYSLPNANIDFVAVFANTRRGRIVIPLRRS